MSENKRWAVIEQLDLNDRPTEIHVVPENDLIPHEIPADDCPCGPRWEREKGINLYTHHSLDGREHNE